jgi:peptide subunit release factor RF-3
MKITHEEVSDRMLGAIDRLVLYDVLMLRDAEEYDLHPSFASYLHLTTRLMESNPKQKAELATAKTTN